MITLTTEQAQQIDEALEDIVRVFKFETGTPVEALATIRAARAQEQAEQEPVAFRFPRDTESWTGGWTIDYKVIRSVDAEIEDNEFKPCLESVEKVLLALEKVYAAPQPVQQEPVAFQMICPRCKVDRVTTPCPRGGVSDCPMTATAQNAAPVQQIDLTDELQQKCSDWGTYWRAPDAHGVNLSIEQATELLRDALGVEVEITPPVRTKDLTEQEIQDAIINISPTGTGYFLRIARAVIAADRELNKRELY